MRLYGYARVSSKDQNEIRQVLALREHGVKDADLFVDKQSGKDFDRPAYKALMETLREGDVLAVKSIDRLGRNYEEIIAQWRAITKKKKAGIVVLDMPLLDTSRDNDLTGTFIADLVLQILSYVAETERANIKLRQAEGIAAARLRGVRFGHPRKEIPPGFYALRERWIKKDVSSRRAAEKLGISHDTFLRWVKETSL